MKYIKFVILNFKGIQKLTIDLTQQPNGKVFPFVGLNQAGKTTILEAIDFFQNNHKISDDLLYKLIHKKDASNFTGDIVIGVKIELDKNEIQMINDKLIENELEIKNEIKTMAIVKCWNFNNARFIERKIDIWRYDNSDFEVKRKTETEFSPLNKLNKELLEELKELLKEHLPKIIYFPNFYFNFPNKIYLGSTLNSSLNYTELENIENYRNIIDDILKSINKSYSVNDLLSKIKDKINNSSQNSAKNLINEIKKVLNTKIIKRWKQIFPSNKNLDLNLDVNYSQDNEYYYLSITIEKGGRSFEIEDESLGFRWFFSFILNTEFRINREQENGEYIFLFDEPAINLHEASQAKLIELFKIISQEGAKILYTTHSPYLIDDKNLLNTFVVKDEGFNYTDNFNYVQNIKAYPYKNYVSIINLNNKDETMHFQPLLNAIEYKEHIFLPKSNIIFTEGKSDYYAYKWIKTIFFNDKNFNFYPGTGVDKYMDLIRNYLAHNENFICIFDSDLQGVEAQKKYIKDISIDLKDCIFTYIDIDPKFNDYKIESLFTEDDKLKIQKSCFPELENFEKSKFNTALQDCYINKRNIQISIKTKKNFKKIFDFIEKNFKKILNIN